MWLTYEKCNEIILQAWNQDKSRSIAYQLVCKPNETKKAIIKWDKDVKEWFKTELMNSNTL